MTELLWLALVIGGMLACYFLIAPLIIYGTMSMQVTGVISDVAPPNIDPADLAFFDQTGTSLEAIGFLPVGDLKIDGMAANIVVICRLFANTGSDTLAMANAVYVKLSGVTRLLRYNIEFSSDCTDGSELVTTTATEAATVDLPPDKHVLPLPQVRDPDLLHRCHRRWMAECAGTKTPRRIPLDMTPVELLEAEVARQMKRKADMGMWRDVGDGRYRLGLVNAYKMTWSQMFPWKHLRNARMMRHARVFVRQAVDSEG